ncbi:ABC transporter permease [Candidatus Bathyarchaeota archaeon]|nr:ABC transporter permease [Candidatus Bathyarchaeota archaeon]NIV43755.1 ABC transporter permease [Candidatus Bathyarchaeota archaeon]
MSFFSSAIRIAEKDLKAEFRRAHEILSILIFSVSSVLICSFAWGTTLTNRPEIAASAIWIILFFASVLTFTTSFTRETDRGTLGGLRTLPCSSSAVLLGKILYAIVLLFLVECVLLLCSGVFLNPRLYERFAELLLIFFLAIVDLSLAGSFVSGLVMFSEGKTLLLSFLLFPACMPVLLPSVLATEKIVNGLSLASLVPELRLLLAFLLSVTAVAGLTFKFVLEE